MDILKLQQARVRPAVRIYQAVHTEIPVMRNFPMVAAVGVHFLSGNGSARLDGMVAPLPDKAPADAVVLLNQLKVILQVAGPLPMA